MELNLAENIRKFRKERKLTQEQFAEIFDITPGAVYKWEAGLSVPELNLIVEMADFFDTSVDVLLGYKMMDSNVDVLCQRLIRQYQERSEDVLVEAEKALKKYPNAFNVVHVAAMVYRLTGMDKNDSDMLLRSIALSEQSLLLVSQNTDARAGELTIYGDIASAYIALGEYEKGIELLKKHNEMGVYSMNIGFALIKTGNMKEAKDYLSESLIQGFSKTVSSIFEMSAVLCAEKKYGEAREMVQSALDMLKNFRKSGTHDFFDKLAAEMTVVIAYAHLKEHDEAAARKILTDARDRAVQFDAAPEYGLGSVRFITLPEGTVTVDSLGDTAMAGINSVLSIINDDELNTLWKEL